MSSTIEVVGKQQKKMHFQVIMGLAMESGYDVLTSVLRCFVNQLLKHGVQHFGAKICFNEQQNEMKIVQVISHFSLLRFKRQICDIDLEMLKYVPKVTSLGKCNFSGNK